MNKDEVISKLVTKTFEQEETINDLKKRINDVNSILYSIGGPLNDNVKKFNKEQLKTFFRIKDAIS